MSHHQIMQGDDNNAIRVTFGITKAIRAMLDMTKDEFAEEQGLSRVRGRDGRKKVARRGELAVMALPT